MEKFEFYNPVRILFGDEHLSTLKDHISEEARILFLYGGGSIKKNGVYDEVIKSLKGRSMVEFAGIEPNPTYEKCMEAVDVIKKESLGFILAVGGGSVIDAAKFIGAAAVYSDGDPWEILSRGKKPSGSLPIGTILTLPATGSEMNSGSVISRQSTGEKFAFSSPFSFPLFSILTPGAASFLPAKQVANGVVDAFIHVIEQYLTYPVNAPLQDRMAESILLTLIQEGPKVYADPADYQSMSNLMWSATMALNGLISCGVPTDWSVHMIGHELTALHGIDHARTLAIVLPGLWKVLKEEKKDKLLQFGERVWGISEGTDDEKADFAITRTEEFFHSLNVPTRLPDYGVGQETIDNIVKRFEKRRWLMIGDRKLITPGICRKVLEDRL